MTEPDLIQKHRNAVKTLLSAVTFTMFDGDVDSDDPLTYPYYVFISGTGIDDKTKVCGESDMTTFRFQITSVGESADAAAIVAGAVRAVVLDARPVVTGRGSVNRIRKETEIPIRADRDITMPGSNRHPLYAVDTYVFESWKD